MGLVRVVLLNEPLDRQACIDHHGPVHAHPAVSASLISRASRIKSAELPGRGFPPNISCRSSAKSSWSALSDNSPAMPVASSLVNSRSMTAWQYPHADAFECGDGFEPPLKGGIQVQGEPLFLGFHGIRLARSIL